jgi:hypothetical protein
VFRKILRMIFPTGVPVPMIIGLTAPHPAWVCFVSKISAANVRNISVSGVPSKYRHYESGLHGYFAKYGPYDSQEWFPETPEDEEWHKLWGRSKHGICNFAYFLVAWSLCQWMADIHEEVAFIVPDKHFESKITRRRYHKWREWYTTTRRPWVGLQTDKQQKMWHHHTTGNRTRTTGEQNTEITARRQITKHVRVWQLESYRWLKRQIHTNHPHPIMWGPVLHCCSFVRCFPEWGRQSGWGGAMEKRKRSKRADEFD